jgi:hypothetical protein
MSAPRIYADFQNLDDDNRLRLTCAGTQADLKSQGIELREGLVLTLYTDDETDEGEPDELLAEGTVQFNKANECWVAAIDWNRIWHKSDEPTKSLPRPAQHNGPLASRESANPTA